MVAVLVVCVGALAAVAAQIRCIDAAREAARLAARADPSATRVAQRVAPSGAGINIRRDGEYVIATVTVRATGLPGLTLSAEAVAVSESATAEPGG
ncbi:TadE family type IV pilus minor pilin [Mycobacterium sp. MS1601]|uniref:TadE family type IV pilus minor pilin n=1 Tax=Mycobacterium sp. MS1601 TaxID=1936029 RepID=UPI003FA60D2B